MNEPADYASALRRTDYEVRDVPISVAHLLVNLFHYARGGPNTAVYLHGLMPAGSVLLTDCVGVAWWIPPTRSAAEATYPADWQGVLSLSRLVVAPEAPKNAASFLLGGSMRLIDRQRWPCLVTYADTAQGHTGAIYRATNWQYVGLTKPQEAFAINGRMTARKAGGRTRTRAEMLALGAVSTGSSTKHKFVHVEHGRRLPA